MKARYGAGRSVGMSIILLEQNDVFDAVMGGLSAEANGADLGDFPPTHRWQCGMQVHVVGFGMECAEERFQRLSQTRPLDPLSW